MEEGKNVGGRPAWVPSQKEIELAGTYAERGLTKEQIAAALGICYDTLNEKTKEYTEFSDAIKRGKARGIAMVADSLLKNVNKGNVTAQIFFLKCQAGWKETIEVQNTGKDGAELPTTQNVTNVMIDERIAQMIKPKDEQA